MPLLDLQGDLSYNNVERGGRKMELDQLNAEQKKAVLYNDGPLLILAGAGSGKTKVLTTKIAYLIKEKQVSPYEILAITFTNKAAKEMKERVENLIQTSAEEKNYKNINEIKIPLAIATVDTISTK